jgi:NADPH:quinone reductase-like Zn-dependent oxidoreductase
MPITSKQWRVERTNIGFDGLVLEEKTVPELTAHEVLVKFHAVALNYRDLMIPRVKAPLLLLTA